MLEGVTDSHRKTPVKVTKSISLSYSASEELLSLLEDFRLMCNAAIRIAVQEKPKNRFKLIELAYPQLKEYGLHTHYILSACEVAFAAYRNKNRKSIPCVRRAFLKLDNQSYALNHLLLRIPTKPRNFIFLTLQGSERHLSYIDDPCLKRASVTITLTSVVIPFSKEVEEFEPTGFVGIDVNERNATASATDGWHHRFDELGEVVEIKERYRDIRAGISQKTRGDRRIAKRFLSKYGKREKRRTESRLHKMTSQIIGYAKANRLGIKMEKLKGIRRLYRKGNGQGPSFRGRMNTWVYGETQRQIDYKAKWDGVPCWYVNPRGTSSNCLCGSRVAPMQDRKLYCPKCGILWDRDDLASKKIMDCVVPQARPSRGSDEGERGGDGSNPRSGWREGRLKG
ncbi:MAG: transposase [Thaumarchaeota archaeon]|nr:transposase [Nitrososphaerota archaeon]